MDKAEDFPEKVRAINADGTRNIAEMARKLNCRMMYISTDYVFDGEGTRPWEPDDERHPLNVYGEMKYEGELAVEELVKKFFIVRIAWVFGLHGNNFVKTMQKEFADIIQKISENQGEVAPEQILDQFRINYIDKKEPIHFQKCQITDTEMDDGNFATLAKVTYTNNGVEKEFEGVGNGPIDAVQRGIEEELGIQIKVLDYSEHALRSGSNAQAASYIHMLDVKTGKTTYGVGISSNITRASLRGIFSAINRLFY